MLMLSRKWTFLRYNVFFFHDIHRKQGRSLSKSSNKIQKICGGKMYSSTRSFGAEVHKSQDGTTSIKYQIILKDTTFV